MLQVIQANAPLPSAIDPNVTTILSAATVVANGSSIVSNFGGREAVLVVNITSAPTGTTPNLTFTIQEIDPINQTTLLGSSVSTTAFTAAGVQTIALPLSTGGAVKVSWTISGASASFTNVDVWLAQRLGGTIKEASTLPAATDTALVVTARDNVTVVGPVANGIAAAGNPILNAAMDAGGLVSTILAANDRSQVVTIGPNTIALLANATIVATGSTVIRNIGAREVTLNVNIKNAPTGTAPSVTWQMYELDPGDQSTVIGVTVGGTAMNAAGTQQVTLHLAKGGTLLVQWVVSGTTPSFTGVYATVTQKDSHPLVLVDPSSIERLALCDLKGSQQVTIAHSRSRATYGAGNTAGQSTGTTNSVTTSIAYLFKGAGVTKDYLIRRILVACTGGSGGQFYTVRGDFITAENGTPGGTTRTPQPYERSDAASGATFRINASGAPTRVGNDPMTVVVAAGATIIFDLLDASLGGKPIVLRSGVAEGFELRIVTSGTNLTGAAEVTTTWEWVEE